ncbi:MAG: hypothetical protein JST54_17555 [Deltaproteobacteria bacterium]|nr:hypothetical protein [Deltaproteobacteria bacterium]
MVILNGFSLDGGWVGSVRAGATDSEEIWEISDPDGGDVSFDSSAPAGWAHGQVPASQAGTVTVTSGNSSVSMAPDDDGGQLPGEYESSSITPLLPWTPGEPFVISALGGTVPPFSFELVAPKPMQILSPQIPDGGAHLAVELDAGLNLRWANASCGDRVVIEVHHSGLDTSTVTRIAVPANAGSYTVPGDLIIPDSNVEITVSSYRMVVVDAGAWEVIGEARVEATWPDGGPFFVDLDFP